MAQKSLDDQLRRAVRGIPLRKLEAETGVDRGALGRWLRGKRSLNLKTADKIARAYGLQFAPRKGGRR